MGEPVVQLDGTTATVVAIQAVPGTAAMWDLSVSNVHTFAVGAGQFVVHNCPPSDAGASSGSSGGEHTPGWEDPNTLNDHFNRHGGEFNAQTPEEYVQKSQDFREQGLDPNRSGSILRKFDPVDNSYRMYDPGTNTFGTYAADDDTITFYKPDPSEHPFPTNMDYWERGVQGIEF